MLTTQYVSELRLRTEDVPSFDSYPFSLPVIRNLDQLKFHPKVTFIIGENGSGKSTLLEAVAVALGFNAEGGSRNFNFSTHASHSELHDYLRISKGYRQPKDGFFLRAESFFNVATEVQNRNVRGYGDRDLHAQSHGEAFLSLLMHRFRGRGLYLLDEPEAALSPQRQLAVLTRLHQLVEDDSQFIIATHSPILMAYPDAWIYACTQDGIERIAYEETEHYQVTRNFLLHPQRMLDVLLADSSD
ncbi:MAG: AAA family ATPase, partial [Burkholderiaceae bacterium]|nr:AAA family ATPase [Burkholderiaceae bacterium]